MIRKLLWLLPPADRLKLYGIFLMMLFGAALEAVGFGLIMPFVAALSDPQILYREPQVSRVLDQLGAETGSQRIIVLAGGLLALFALKNGYLALLYRVQFRFLYARQHALSRRLLASYVRAPYVFHLQRNSSELLRNVNHAALSVYHNIAVPLLIVASEAAVALLFVLLLATVDPFNTVLVIGVIGVSSAGFFWFLRRRLASIGRVQHASEAAMIQAVNQSLGAVKETKALGREDLFLARYDQDAGMFNRAMRSLQTLQQMPRLFIESIAVLAMVLLVWSSVWRSGSTAPVLPALALFAVAAFRLLPSASRIVSMLSQARYFGPALDTVCGDLAMVSATAPPVDTGGRLNGDVRFDRISYCYPGSASPALTDVDLQVPTGTAVAIVGRSGAGKSTLVDLLLGLLEPSSGRLTAGGVDVHGSLHRWRQSIGYVPQVIFLIDDSIRRNVAFGIPDERIDDDAIWRALEQTCAADFVRALPGGLDTAVGERGVRISGGERQRIGIARALYHNPDVLVFDEATSALDVQTESDITSAIYALRGCKTMFVVTHRLASIVECDRAIVLEGGRVVKDTLPAALMGLEQPA